MYRYVCWSNPILIQSMIAINLISSDQLEKAFFLCPISTEERVSSHNVVAMFQDESTID